MAFTLQPLEGTADQAITITLASLAAGSYRQSTAIDNTSTLFTDVGIRFQFKNTSTPTAGGFWQVYAYGSTGGTAYSSNATGTDGAYTIDVAGNPTIIASVAVPASATPIVYSPLIYVAQAMQWAAMPAKWGIIVFNGTSTAGDATEGNFVKVYQGVNIRGV
jgi:hypothetical protein